MKVSKNILIRNISERHNEILENLRGEFGVKTNSQAVLRMIETFGLLKNDLENMKTEFLKITKENFENSLKINAIRQAMGYKREMNLRKKFVIKSTTEKI